MKYITSLGLIISLVLIYSFSVSSDIVITGVVQDSRTGEELIGANIIATNHNRIGTATDIDGTFSLSVPSLPVKLRISYTGYADQVIKLKTIEECNDIRISLQEGAILDEVVVTGYSPRSRKKTRGNPRRTSRKNQSADFIGVKISDLSGNAYDVSHSPASEGGFCGTYSYKWDNNINDSESYPSYTENPFTRPLDEALSTFSVDVDRASYSNVRRFIKGGQLPPAEAIRIEEMINYFEYDYPQPKGKDPIAIQSNLTECPWNKEHQLLHIGIQGKKIPTADLPPSNLVFLIDVSGSMDSHNKLPLVKASMKLLVDQLRPKDRVAIVTYAGHAGVALKSTLASKKYTIMQAIEDMDAGGSTGGAQGIKTAYKIAKENLMKEGNNRVILATDGDFNMGVSSNEGLETLIEKERKSGISLSILGYGMGNYKDDKMQSLAQAGNGNHAYIDDLQEAEKTLINEFGSTLFTIAKDVKVQIEFNPSKVNAYRLVGYETRMLAKEDFNNDKVDAGDMGSGHTVTAIYEIIPSGSKSTFYGSVDELKYQQQKKNTTLTNNSEVATVKFRYKAPDGDTSKKLELTVSELVKSSDLGDDANWAIATACFGMKLRESPFIDYLSYEKILRLAKNSKGSDEEGYKAEMIRLIRSAKSLSAEYLLAQDE